MAQPEPMSLAEARKLIRHWEQPPRFPSAAQYRAALAIVGLPDLIAQKIASDDDWRAGLIQEIQNLNARQGDPAVLAEFIRNMLEAP